jgi:hypothetical protein
MRLAHAAPNGSPLETLFPAEDGFEILQDLAWRVVIAPTNFQDVYIQFTVGVPLTGMYEFLRFVAGHSPGSVTELFAAGLTLLRDGLDFGAMMARLMGRPAYELGIREIKPLGEGNADMPRLRLATLDGRAIA